MPVIKFSICEQWMAQLEQEAREQNITVQDLVRLKLFGRADEGPRAIFTPEEAVRRALEKYEPEEEFTLPELYDDEWTLTREAGDNGEPGAGPFGRKFFDYLQAHEDIPIRYVPGRTRCRQTLYCRVKKEEN